MNVSISVEAVELGNKVVREFDTDDFEASEILESMLEYLTDAEENS